ncbi:MAG: FeoB-associated Cys-rich membrane protein [Pyrinomonadaceae bacterium]
MNVQNIVVAIIVLFALVYVGSILLGKIKSFSSKSGCGADCGCEGKQKSKIAKI